MYVTLVQYPHLVSCVVVGPNVVPSSVVPNPTPQKVLLPIQDEHGDAMEDSEWVHKGLRWCCKVDACTSSYAAKWLFRQHLERTNPFKCKSGNQGIHLFILGGLNNKILIL